MIQPKAKSRNSNLELYRIIVMLLIVAHHCVLHSGVLLETLPQTPICAKSIFYYVMGMWGKTGIDCFVLITGYFMCKTSITLRKYLKLLMEVVFYNVVIYVLFVIVDKQPLSLARLFFAVFPFQDIGGLFVPCFLLFYLFIPYLTILVTHLGKKKHTLLLALCLGIYSVMMTMPHFHVTMNYITWYCVLFFISSYIRNYGLFPKLKSNKWGGISLLCILLSIISVICVVYFDEKWGRLTPPYKYVDVSGVCAVLTSVSSFMFFKDFKLRNYRWINLVASGTFGVLLIHDNNSEMRQWLWRSLLDVKQIYAMDDSKAYLYPILIVCNIFVICVVIDLMRKYTIEKYTFKLIDKYIQ